MKLVPHSKGTIVKISALVTNFVRKPLIVAKKIEKMVHSNYSPIQHVTKNFSLGYNFCCRTFDCTQISKSCLIQIIQQFDRVTTHWQICQNGAPLKFTRLLKWSCLGHDNTNQSKNPEYQAGRVDVAVEQCAIPTNYEWST